MRADEALLTQTSDPCGNLYARAGADVTSYDFTGEQADSSGLLYLRARYYAPGQGRFFQMDPSRQEMNPYQYAAGNPVNFSDPSGLCWNNPDATPTEQAICLEAWERRLDEGYVEDYQSSYFSIYLYEDFKLRWNRGFEPVSEDQYALMGAGTFGVCALDGPAPFADLAMAITILGVIICQQVAQPPDLYFDFSAAEMHHGFSSYSPLSVPHDRAFEAQDPQLEKWVRELYPPNATVGSGSAADALREEAETGQPVGGKWHEQKVQEIADRLERWIEAKMRGYVYNDDENLLEDIELGEEILEDLKDALEQWDESPHNE